MQPFTQIAPAPRQVANDRNDPASFLSINGGHARLYPPFEYLGWQVSRTEAGQYIAQKGDETVYGTSVREACAAAASANYVEGLPFEGGSEGNNKHCVCVSHKHRNWAAMCAQGVARGNPTFRADIHCTFCDGTGWVL